LKAHPAISAVLAVLFLSSWSSCGNLPAWISDEASYTVSYYPNGSTSGSAPVDEASYAEGSPVKVLGNVGNLAKAGFLFSGWNTQANGNGTTYIQGQNFIMGKADFRLFAKWATNTTYTVSYNGNGATGGSAPSSETGLASGASLSLPSNTGSLYRINPYGDGVSYCFKGWNTDQAATAALPSPYTVTGNATLYAVWTPFVVTDTGPAGGLVFYDKGSYDNAPSGVGASWRYMEAAPEEAELSPRSNDFNGGDNGSPIGGTYADVGYGLENTTHLATDLFTPYGGGTPRSFSPTSPAGACYELVFNGFDDWFLPSEAEMLLMYTELKLKGLGGIKDNSFYWDSFWGPNWDSTGFFNTADGSSGYMWNTNGALGRPARRF